MLSPPPVWYTSPVYPLLQVAQPLPTLRCRSAGATPTVPRPEGVVTPDTAESRGCGSEPKGRMLYGPSVVGGGPVPGDPSNMIVPAQAAGGGGGNPDRKSKRL